MTKTFFTHSQYKPVIIDLARACLKCSSDSDFLNDQSNAVQSVKDIMLKILLFHLYGTPPCFSAIFRKEDNF